MAKLIEMANHQLRGAPVIEHNIGHAIDLFMACHSHYGNGQLVLKQSVNRNDPFGAATEQEAGILLNEVRLVAMMCAEIKVALAHQVIADSAHDQRMVTVAQFR